ncbi:hypothetical protein D3C74_432690 [compost metagenome]
MSRPKRNEYAVYRGEELLAMGNVDECSETLGVSTSYIYWLISPTAKKRLEKRKNLDQCIVGVRLDYDDE